MQLKETLLVSWRRLSTGGVNASIFRAVMLVGGFSVLVKVAATIKELLVANSFGRSDAVDAFLIAFLIPQTIINLTTTSFSASLVPVFARVRAERGQLSAQSVLMRTLVASEAALVAFSALLGFCAPWIMRAIGSNFSPAKRDLTCHLCYWLLPYVVINGFTIILGAVLNLYRRFLVTSISPLLTPLLTLLIIALYVNRWGIWTLVIGTLIGAAFEALVTLLAFLACGLRLTWGGNDLGHQVKSVLRQYLPLLGAGVLTGGIGLVDQSITASLSAGSVAAFAYGTKVVAVILTVMSGSLGTVLIPYFSEMAAQNDWHGCQKTIRIYSRLLLIVCVPLTIGMITFSHPLIRCLYQHGAFTANDTRVVSAVQIAYAISIPFVGLGCIYVRFLSSVRRNEILMLVGVINLVLDIVFDIVLGKLFGVAGIALATSLFYVASCALLVYFGRREMRRLSQDRMPLLSCG
jgi:putative peptidoglycan lipid II flippase